MDSAKILEISVTAGAILVAAFAGAWAAFRLGEQARKKDETEKRVAAANRALFTLSRQLNLMAIIQKQYLDPVRSHPARHIAMLPTLLVDYPDYRITLLSLDFLLGTEFRESLLEMLIRDDWFQHAVEAVKLRYRLHHDLAQPKIESVSRVTGGEAKFSAIETALGERLSVELKQATDSLFTFIDEGCDKHVKFGLRLCQELEQLFPAHKFIRFGVDPKYRLPGES